MKTILILGGSGFIGRSLLRRLAKESYHLRVPTRSREHAKSLFVLPNVEVIEADIHDPAQLNELCRNVDAVINLVGILHSKNGHPYGPDFEKVHVQLVENLIAAMQKNICTRLIHLSALAANKDGSSMYLRSKAAGEKIIHKHSDIHATLFRPSVIFGEEDRFLNMFAQLQRYLPFVLLGFAHAKFQPVYVGDVVEAISRALKQVHTIGKTYELVGPEIYSLKQLVKLAGEYSGHTRPIIALPEPLAYLQALLLEILPGQLLSRDNLDSMRIANVATDLPDLSSPELSISPQALSSIAPYYLKSIS